MFFGILDESGAAGSWQVFATVGVDRLDMCCSSSLSYSEVSAQDWAMTMWPNKPAAGKAGFALQLAIERHRPALPEQQR